MLIFTFFIAFHQFIDANAQALADTFKVLLSKEIPEQEKLPANYLKLEIAFVNDPPYTKGFPFFKKEKLLIKMKLSNISDTTYYIPSVFQYYSPKFTLMRDGKPISRMKIVHINPVINLEFFHKLDPKESFDVLIDVQERHRFDLKKGHYLLTASIYSEFGKLILNDKKYPIWNGYIDSNALSFAIE